MDEFQGQDTEEIEHKRPYKWIKLAVGRVVNTAIPLHLQLLRTHHENIKQYHNQEEWTALHAEEVRASNTILLLKGDIYELQAISVQVQEEDTELFQQETEQATQEVLNALASFLELYPHVISSRSKGNYSLTSTTEDFPTLICNVDEQSTILEDSRPFAEAPLPEIQVLEPVKLGGRKRWSKLRNELLELNDLFKKFANLVFSHKEHIDTIEGNISQASVNVQEGNKQLRKAVIFQAAAFPVTGAAIGGLLLGPVGAAVGFKLFGSVACALSGCALGYGAGWKLKQKRYASCDLEMKALTFTSRTASLSSPDIVQIPELITCNESDKTASSLNS